MAYSFDTKGPKSSNAYNIGKALYEGFFNNSTIGGLGAGLLGYKTPEVVQPQQSTPKQVPNIIYNNPSLQSQPYQTAGMIPNPQLNKSASQSAAQTTVQSAGGAPTSSEQAVMDRNAALMKQYGQGNYTITAEGNVIPKTQVQTQNTPSPATYNQPATTPTTETPTNQFSTNIQQLTAYGKGEDPELRAQIEGAAQEIQDLKKEYAQKGVDINQTAGFLTQATGEQGLLNQQYLSALEGLENKYNRLTGLRAQNIGAAGTAGGLAQPVGQFGMLTNPQTGQPLNTQVFQSAIQQAQQLVNNGTPANDASVQALLSPFGFVGPLAFNQAMQQAQGNWNPAAQSAGASQTLAQGTQVQGQAFQLDTGIKQLATLQPIINSVMQSSGINSTDSPLYNQQIGTYISQLGNPGAWSQFQFALGEMRKFQSQLLASGAGGIPTDVSNTINSTDISKLSLKDINTALETLDILGKNQQSVLQSQQRATGVTGYSGAQQNVQANIPTATPSTSPGGGVTNPAGQFAAGAGLGIAQDAASNLSKMILSFLAGLKLGK